MEQEEIYYGGCENFFSERTHQTRVATALSPPAELSSGVIQGIGIGPLIFLVFVNELAEILARADRKD